MNQSATARIVAQRLALGLNMTEISSLPTILQSNRVISNYERGDRTPSPKYIESMERIACKYKHLLGLALLDIQTLKVLGLPQAGDGTEPIVMPYYYSLNDFYKGTGNEDIEDWRVYTAVINHLVITDAIAVSDDKKNCKIPIFFENTLSWLKKMRQT